MRAYVCDHCQAVNETTVFEVCQAIDEFDEDGDQITITLHLCSTACLTGYAMGLSLDFPEEPE